MQAASKSRSAKVPVPIRTAIGSRPKNPRATIRSLSPGRKPSSANRRLNPPPVPESADPGSVPDTATTRAAAPVHILIVPNKVIPTTDDIEDDDEALLGHMVIVARDLAREHGVAKSGYRLIINCNPDSGQEVYHLHLHLIGGRPLGPLVQRA